jgi:DNA-binding GntR family transcriptional regulator
MPQALKGRIEPPSSVGSSKIKRGVPLYEQIYGELWNLIFTGQILPGQRLSDREWAQRLATSRTPVREAMRQMARDGVLLGLENGGYQVRTVDPQGLANLYECRAPLAALAVRDTTVNGNERLFTQIRATVKSTSKAIDDRDANASLRLNSKFHSLVVESCGNSYLTVIMANLEKLILFYRIALLKTASGDDAHRHEYFEHLARGNERQLQIAEAMAQRNAEKAGRLMEQHLLSSAEDMARLLQQA